MCHCSLSSAAGLGDTAENTAPSAAFGRKPKTRFFTDSRGTPSPAMRTHVWHGAHPAAERRRRVAWGARPQGSDVRNLLQPRRGDVALPALAACEHDACTDVAPLGLCGASRQGLGLAPQATRPRPSRSELLPAVAQDVL